MTESVDERLAECLFRKCRNGGTRKALSNFDLAVSGSEAVKQRLKALQKRQRHLFIRENIRAGKMLKNRSGPRKKLSDPFFLSQNEKPGNRRNQAFRRTVNQAQRLVEILIPEIHEALGSVVGRRDK